MKYNATNLKSREDIGDTDDPKYLGMFITSTEVY